MWPGCKPVMPCARVMRLDNLVPMARCVLRMLYCNCIFSPRENTAAASAIICASSVSGTSLRPSIVQ